MTRAAGEAPLGRRRGSAWIQAQAVPPGRCSDTRCSSPAARFRRMSDDLVRGLRERIAENDRRIVELLNARLELVARLRRVKEERGLDFVDRGREAWLLEHLQETNTGPLSPEGLEEVYRAVLELTKREVSR